MTALPYRALFIAVIFAALSLNCSSGASAPTASNASPEVAFDAAKITGQLPRFALYTNTSLRFAPPHALAGRVESEYGKPIITRVWLPLDDMWDYRDNSYHFNFGIGADRYANDTVKSKYDRGIVLPSNIHFEDYLRDFSEHSKYLLLNIRRYEVEVVNGTISLEKWKGVVKAALLHYKKEYGNLRYIEALNEYHGRDFGSLTDEQYYRFYKAVYEAVNEVNQELKPTIPLEMGGPVVVGAPLNSDSVSGQPGAGNKTLRLYHFLQRYAADPDPEKKLDFIAFHDYDLGSDFSAIAGYEAIVRKLLGDFQLNQSLPIFITEIGYAGPKPMADLNLHQATGISELFFYSRTSMQLHLFPWVLYHEPARQLSLTAFILKPDLRMTPFGEALKMCSMQGDSEIESRWSSPVRGLGALASRNGKRIVIQMWNDTAEAISTSAVVSNLARSPGRQIRIREYQIDSQHNNVFGDPASGLALVASSDTKSSEVRQRISVTLEPYSLVMWTFDVTGN